MNAPAFPPVIRLADERFRQRLHRIIDALPIGWVVRFSPATRSLEQNALLHALIAEAVRKGFATDNGRRLTIDDAKTALVGAWMREQGEEIDIIALEGHAIQLRRSTTTFTKAELSSLVEFIHAVCAKRGIFLSEGRHAA